LAKRIQAVPVIPGNVKGKALVSKIPLSFWGGVDVKTGAVVDVHHDLCGSVITGKVLFIPAGRGSCSGSGIILEMIRQKTAPLAIISLEAEPILAIGSIIGRELYGSVVPVYVVKKEDYDSVLSDDDVIIEPVQCSTL